MAGLHTLLKHRRASVFASSGCRRLFILVILVILDPNNAQHNIVHAMPVSQNENQALRQRAAEAEQTNSRLLQVL